MNTPTTYKITRQGRFDHLFYSILLTGTALGIIYIFFFNNEALLDPETLLLDIIFGVMICLFIAYAILGLLRAIGQEVRIVVDEYGFSYNGILNTTRLKWEDVVSLKLVYGTRPPTPMIKVTVKTENNHTRLIKLDFTGLNPDKVAFAEQALLLAPWIEVTYGFTAKFHQKK